MTKTIARGETPAAMLPCRLHTVIFLQPDPLAVDLRISTTAALRPARLLAQRLPHAA